MHNVLSSFCFIQLETKENGIDKHKGGLSGVNLGLWQIDETVEEFFDRYPWLIKYNVLLSERYKNEGRKEEFLAVRALLHEMLGDKVGRLLITRLENLCLRAIMSVSLIRGDLPLWLFRRTERWVLMWSTSVTG